MSTIIVNADDFGHSEGINRAIAECFERGYCSSTSIMANMPAFEAACEIAHRRKLLAHVGVHLVLTEGQPLTDQIRNCPRFCDLDGRFRLTRKERVWRLDTPEKAAVAEEFRAQIARCGRHGLPLGHADSHNHVHEEWAILSVVMQVCKEEHIPAVRIARNCGVSTGLVRTLYRCEVNRRLRRHKLARTQYFGSLDDYRFLCQRHPGTSEGKSVEVMVHPDYSRDGKIIDCTLPSSRLCLKPHLWSVLEAGSP